MEMRFYLRIIRRGWWLILIAALVAVNFSLIYVSKIRECVLLWVIEPTNDSDTMKQNLDIIPHKSSGDS